MEHTCPYCHSHYIKKNGHHQNGQQNWLCSDCKRQFVQHPLRRSISEETKTQVRSLLTERLSLRAICRQTNVSLSWLIWFLKKEASKIPSHLHAQKVAHSEFTEVYHLQIDELWTFVQSKHLAQWIWIVLDSSSRQILAYQIGPRKASTLRSLLAKLPEELKKNQSFIQTDLLPTST